MSLPSAAAGPMFLPNSTMEELGCLMDAGHRWVGAHTEGGRMVRKWECLPG